MPSTGAQEKLLKHLECSPSDVTSLRYRGDGWPGYTTAIDKQGKRHQTDYATSRGSILGRDIMKMCRFCLDGIGEMADISCGDAWYLTDNKKPDFAEAQGRNMIFARTRKGAEILKHINEQKKITLTETTTADLRFIQTYQWERKATMIDKIMSMTVKNKKTPRYRIKNVVAFATSVGVRKLLLEKHTRIAASVLIYISKHSVPIIALHFLAFKIVNVCAVALREMPKYMIAAFPVLMTDGLWWLLYVIVGIAVPLCIDFNVRYVKNLIEKGGGN